MQGATNIAFKEWAVVVDALGHGEQILIFRKGGIREQRGQFDMDHRAFWLFPTQYHEAENSVIPSKRPAVRRLADAAPREVVPIQYYAVADQVWNVTDRSRLSRLQGRHIWTEDVVRQRFEFGREQGLHVLVVRVFRRPQPEWLPLRAQYGGCRSWVELEQWLGTVELAPVLDDLAFNQQRDEITERLNDHAFAHS